MDITKQDVEEIKAYLKRIATAIEAIAKKTEPKFVPDSIEQKLRNP